MACEQPNNNTSSSTQGCSSSSSSAPVFVFGVNLNELTPSTSSAPAFDLNLDSHSLRPPGKPYSSRYPDELVGHLLQVWELLWRFSEVLEVKVPLSFEEFEDVLSFPHVRYSNLLRKGATNDEDFHCLLLKVLIHELHPKVAATADPTFNSPVTYSRHLKRKDEERSHLFQNLKISVPPINALTWTELTRRYITTRQDNDSNVDVNDISSRNGENISSCLQGDGEALCGLFAEVAPLEAYTLILAKATEKIFGPGKRTNYVWPKDYNDIIDSGSSLEATSVVSTNTPEWAKLLEPVRNLRTNVGSRIRKCIHSALEKNPPQWARKILVDSISKEVYKANAAGPTKRAVLSVLSNVSGPFRKPVKGRKINRINSVTDLIMDQCGSVLQRAVAGYEAKDFCNMLGISSYSDDSVHKSLPTLPLPLDFTTVYLRLAVGAYCGSHEAFLEDVNEVWIISQTACRDEPDLMQLVQKLSQSFIVLYEKEVIALVQRCLEPSDSKCPTAASWKEPDVIAHVNFLAEGICKACRIDKDDERVLLCDACDSEYHTYCLRPPLVNIPKGNWYCPSCDVVRCQPKVALVHTHTAKVHNPKKCQDNICTLSEQLKHLASTMKEKDYWELLIEERILLLRFLCDEILDSSLIRRHLERCDHVSYLSLLNFQPGTVELVNSFDSQASKMSLRRDLLGRDSSGRLYWILGGPGTHLQLVVDGSMEVQLDRTVPTEYSEPVAGSSYRHEPQYGVQSSWVSYNSSSEIEELLRCLRDTEPVEKELKQNIGKWLRLMNQHSQQDTYPVPDDPPVSMSSNPKRTTTSSLNTEALSILNRRYGPLLEPDFTFIPRNSSWGAESTNERRLYRCECLEPVWPSRHHCFSCHQTFSAKEELEGHTERNYTSISSTQTDSSLRDPLKCKGMIMSESTNVTVRNAVDIVKELKEGADCPSDLEESCSRITRKNSNNEVLCKTGIFDSNGTPDFILSMPPCMHDPSLTMDNTEKGETHSSVRATDFGVRLNALEGNKLRLTSGNKSRSFKQCSQNGIYGESIFTDQTSLGCLNDREVVSPLNSTASGVQIMDNSMVPESSFKPLSGTTIQFLRYLKSSLLDMEAALPEEALKPSKLNRIAWRNFVKSSGSIYEMIQATIVFESMIKARHLRSGWLYWSYLSAAAKASTISSLALCIYSLDAAIIYGTTNK